jgi:GntR family transcriptional regulator
MSVEDEIMSRMPTDEEVERLSLRPATPVLVHIRTGRKADEQPVRVAVTIMPGDKGVLFYKLLRP